jgi:hypothetical protein
MIKVNNKHGFVKTMNAVVLLFIISLFLAACASNEPLPLQTEEFFTSRINDAGKTQFAFGLAWKMDEDMPEEQGQNHVRRPPTGDSPKFNGADRGPGNNQLDKQSKLQLEDQAAEKLQAQIDKRQLCDNGHEVEQVIWEVGRVRLMGHCL